MAFLPKVSERVVLVARSQATSAPLSSLESTREGSTQLQDREVTLALDETATDC